MKHYRSSILKDDSRAFLLGFLVWMVLIFVSAAGWAGPSPLPLDPPADTEAFISQLLSTQLNGVSDAGSLAFQNIGGPAGIEYNNIGYDPVTRYLYGVQVTETGAGGGNLGLIRIGLDPADPSELLVQPLGWPGYPVATAPWGADGSAYPRYDAGDVDPVNRLFFVHVQGQQVGNGCLNNPSVCTDRVRSFDIDALPAPGADPADLDAAYGVSRVFKAVQGGPALNTTARVADWAFKDGKLYGGDAATGLLAVNTPNAVDDDPDPSDDPTHALFNRFAFDPGGVASGLDTTVANTADAYGAAWFIGDILYLYRNGGVNNEPARVFKIDLQIDAVTGDPFPKIIEIVENVAVVTRNDGASFFSDETVAFECTGEPFIVFDFASQLNQIDPDLGASTFSFNIIADPINGRQINNLGFRSTDGLLYGWERNGADNGGQIVRIDSTGAVTGLGQTNPPLPANQTPSGCTIGVTCTAFNYNAGDVSVDGTQMYLSYSQQNGAGGKLYIVDLTSPTPLPRIAVDITGNSGAVADWAAHPTNGLLYGGDHTHWELATLNPATGARTDLDIGLPNEGSLGYGAAWFSASGRLFLYHNSGKIYAVDNVDSTPVLVGAPYPLVNLALNTSNNDGANCAAGDESAPAIVIEKSTNGVDADDPAEGPMLTVGDPVTWEYLVTNTGNVDLSGVTVSDDQAGVTPGYISGDDGDNILQPGETWIYQATGVAVVGLYGNIGTATGTPPEGEDVTDSDPSHYFGDPAPEPSIDIEKRTNGQDADTAETGPVLTVGDAVTWVYEVTNTGDVALSAVEVKDDQGVIPIYQSEIVGNGDGSFDPLEKWLYTAEGTAVEGQYVNIGTADGTSPAGVTVTDSDPSHYSGESAAVPAIDIEKSTNGEDADTAPGPTLTAGVAVTWEYEVTNTGTVALVGVTVSDDQGVTPVRVSGGDGDNILQPGEVWIFRASGTAVEGPYANIGTASGTSPQGDPVSDTDPSHYQGVPAGGPSIDIEKSISLVGETGPWNDADDPPGPELMAGDGVWFQFVIANNGDVGLTEITLSDTVFDLNSCGVIPDLAAGETFTCVIGPLEATGVAHTNTATATGSYNGQTVEDVDPAHYGGSFWSFTPGFWKNHFKGKHDAWKYTAYEPGQMLDEVFTGAGCLDDYGLQKRNSTDVFSELSLLQALSFQGNETIAGAMEILLRAAVASLLNASFHEVMSNPIGDGGVYPYTVTEVIDMVEAVLCSADRALILTLASQLDDLNNGIHHIDWKWLAP